MCTFAHGYVCFLVNCKDNQKRADTNTSASPNLLMGLQCLADSNIHKCYGWYIYSNISNGTKAEDLKRISAYYHLGLKIEEGKPE